MSKWIVEIKNGDWHYATGHQTRKAAVASARIFRAGGHKVRIVANNPAKGTAAAKLLRAMGIKGVKQARIRRNKGSVTVIPIRNRK